MSENIDQIKVPSGWELHNLGNLIAVAQSGFACGSRDENGVIQLRMNNVDTRGKILLNEFLRVPASDDMIARYKLLPNDVLFNNTNSTELVGKSALFTGHSEPVVFSNHFTRLRPNDNLLIPEFLAAWLNMTWLQGTFAQICNRWIGQSAVKNDKLLGLEMFIPPLAEQKRIVAKLNAQMAAIEKAHQAAEAQLEAANTLNSAYLRNIFNESNTEKWSTHKLGNVCGFIGGMQPPKSTFKHEQTLGYIRLVQIQDFRTEEFPVYIPVKEGKRQFSEDDVMIGRYGPPLFQILRGRSGAYNVALIRTAPNPNILTKRFLYYVLQEEQIQKAVIDQSQRSAGQTGVHKGFLERYEVKLPSIEEQYKISNFLDEKFKTTITLKKHIQSQLAEIKNLPNSVLRDAFSG